MSFQNQNLNLGERLQDKKSKPGKVYGAGHNKHHDDGVYVNGNEAHCKDVLVDEVEEDEEDVCSVGAQVQAFTRDIYISMSAPQDIEICEDECGNVVKKVQFMTKTATPTQWRALNEGDTSISTARNIGVYDHSTATNRGLHSSNAIVRKNHQNMMSALRFDQIRRG